MQYPLAFQTLLPLSRLFPPPGFLNRRKGTVCVTEPPPIPATRNLVSHGFRNIPEVRNPLVIPFDNPCPSYLADHIFYRMTSAIFEANHADGSVWRAEHWFDAIGAAHSFRFDKHAKVVTYRSKVVSSDLLEAIRSQSRTEFRPTQAIMPKPVNTLHRLKQMFSDVQRDDITGRPLVNVCLSLETIPGRGLSARTDANVAQRLDPNTLEPLGKFSFDEVHPKLSGYTASSHGVYDHTNDEYINYVVRSFGAKPGCVEYTLFKIGRDGRGELISSFREPLYLIHSFAVTENYIVMVLWPAEIDMSRIMFTKELGSCVEMRKGRATKFIVVSREEQKIVARYEHEAFFCFHVINSFERDDSIVIDLSRYPDTGCIEKQTIGTITSGESVGEVRPTRFCLDGLSKAISSGSSAVYQASSRELADIFFEDPQVSPAVRMCEYRYAYGVSDGGEGGFFADISKLDVSTGDVLKWGKRDCFVGEALFVPDPNGTAEDDGCLLVVVLDGHQERSSLVVLEARTMVEVSRATLPFIVPHGFHSFFSRADSALM